MDTMSDGETDVAPAVLMIEPAHIVLRLDSTPGSGGASVAYMVQVRSADGTSRDVTASAVLSIDDATLGAFTANFFTSVGSLPTGACGIATRLVAKAEGLVAEGSLAIVAPRANDVSFASAYGAPASPTDEIVVFKSIASDNVTFRVSNNPYNPKGFDATPFVSVVRAMDIGDPGKGCPPTSAKDTDGDGVLDTFTSVTPATQLCFKLLPKSNTVLKPGPLPQYVGVYVEAIAGSTGKPFARDSVCFVVPQKS